ncbi:hypothetical protein [Nannocystis pusilla]|uniref:Uncharacterized protein n=1 Tax=Nannocystis pusilla TaxID=889268 RepID=A0ABS7TPZ4_9BACT|nr:hypothetical protein [Nannocystis pusilla]MBZ5710293.1 hypothetical protein [Nannocystis pusilla]
MFRGTVRAIAGWAIGQVRRGMWIGTAALALGCGPPAVEVLPGVKADLSAGAAGAEGPVAAAPAGDCAGLAAAAAAGSGEDAVLLVWTCPEVQASTAALRAALLQAATPAEAAALAPKLAAAPDLAGLARLAAIDRPSTGSLNPAEAPDPVTALVSPIDEAALGGVLRAIGAQTASGITHEQRTRAAALLARVYREALAQLGLPPGQPLPPFGRLLAGRFLHFGRSFCQTYWQRRVAGLENLFAATEDELMRVMLALERTAHAGDDALLAVERQRARRYLQGRGVAERLKSRGVTPTPESLLPLPNELDRLVDHGFIDLALQRALFLAGEQPAPFGMGPVVESLRSILTQRDLGDFQALLERRIAEARKLEPPPPEQGTREWPVRAPWSWSDAGAIAEAAGQWCEEAGQAEGTARRRGLWRAVLALRERPDACRELLRRADAGGLAAQVARAVLDRLDDDSLATLRTRTAGGEAGEAQVRRTFALASRDAGLLPR